MNRIILSVVFSLISSHAVCGENKSYINPHLHGKCVGMVTKLSEYANTEVLTLKLYNIGQVLHAYGKYTALKSNNADTALYDQGLVDGRETVSKNIENNNFNVLVKYYEDNCLEIFYKSADWLYHNNIHQFNKLTDIFNK
ncbi:hypothetical protein [Pseudomonas phage vB_Pa-PAC2]